MLNQYENIYYEKVDTRTLYNQGKRGIALNFIKENSRDGDSLLEVGCGTAEFLNSLPEYLKYTGIDNSEFAIKKAEQKGERGKFLISKSEKLPFDSEIFDFVVSFYALEHFKNPKGSLGEMIRVLKPGGYLVILAPNLELPFSLPNSIRHKSLFYKILFVLLRIKDYALRLFGIYKFRVINENFTESTGRYEKADDDLSYVVSSLEVINYLSKKYKIIPVIQGEFKFPPGLKNKIKKMITFLPGFKFYGDSLFTILKK